MRAILVVGLCLAVGACDTPNFRTHQFRFGSADTLAATGNLRFVTERKRVLPSGVAHVMCTEPSPDYSTDSGTDFKTTIKGSSTTSPITEGELGLRTTEVTRELSGRSKGVLALRDGLYAACQAYVNGTIGKDAYSIILSQYGLLLVALMRDDTYAKEAGQTARTTISQTPAASAFAAMLVSCINSHDPTRRSTPDRVESNRLLSLSICAPVVRLAASGRLDR